MRISLALAVGLATAGVLMPLGLVAFLDGSTTTFLAGVFLVFTVVAVRVLAGLVLADWVLVALALVAGVLVTGDLVALALLVGVLAARVDEVRDAVFLVVAV